MPRSPRAVAQSKQLDATFSESELRLSIIQEEALRRELARDEALRQRAPDVWRQREATRRESNRVAAVTNARLTALGLAPLRGSPSLAQRQQELRRLERRNEAMIAALRADRPESAAQLNGTPLAGRRSRRRG